MKTNELILPIAIGAGALLLLNKFASTDGNSPLKGLTSGAGEYAASALGQGAVDIIEGTAQGVGTGLWDSLVLAPFQHAYDLRAANDQSFDYSFLWNPLATLSGQVAGEWKYLTTNWGK
jgi:hypothetical protein